MAHNMTVFQQAIANLTAALQAKIEETSELHRLGHQRKGELDLKDTELAVYYKHMADLQQRLDQTHESLTVAERQLEAANRLNKKSIRSLEEFKTRFLTLKRQLDKATHINRMQERHLVSMQRQIVEYPQST